MLIQESAPGKIVICGEYTVLEGNPALALAVNPRVVSTFRPDSLLTISCIAGSKADPSYLKFVNGVFAHLPKLGLSVPIGHYQIDSSALYCDDKKIGLGSSAAVCVALIKTVFKAASHAFSEDELFKAALHIHRKLNNALGSGLDIASCCAEKLIHYQLIANKKNQSTDIRDMQACYSYVADEIAAQFKQIIIPVFSGQSQSTASYVHNFSQLKQSNPSLHQQLIGKLAAANNEFFACLQQAKIYEEDLIAAVKNIAEKLEDLGLAMKVQMHTPAHEKINAIAQNYGAATKISGAGGGDISLCFVKPEFYAALSQKLSAAGFKIIAV